MTYTGEQKFSATENTHPTTKALVRISHQRPGEARNKPAMTALRLLVVLNVGFQYASARPRREISASG